MFTILLLNVMELLNVVGGVLLDVWSSNECSRQHERIINMDIQFCLN